MYTNFKICFNITQEILIWTSVYAHSKWKNLNTNRARIKNYNYKSFITTKNSQISHYNLFLNFAKLLVVFSVRIFRNVNFKQTTQPQVSTLRANESFGKKSNTNYSRTTRRQTSSSRAHNPFPRPQNHRTRKDSQKLAPKRRRKKRRQYLHLLDDACILGWLCGMWPIWDSCLCIVCPRASL